MDGLDCARTRGQREVVEASRGGVNTAWKAVRLVRLWLKSIVNPKQPLNFPLMKGADKQPYNTIELITILRFAICGGLVKRQLQAAHLDHRVAPPRRAQHVFCKPGLLAFLRSTTLCV